MKKLVFGCMIVMAVIAVACSKQADVPWTLTGKWKWNYSVGGLSGNDSMLPPANTTVLLVLNADGSYQRTSNGQVAASGVYRVVDTLTIFSATEKKAVIRFDNDAASEKVIAWDGPRLVLVDNTTDPFGHVYTRVEP